MTRRKPGYTRDNLERALIHHQVDYSPPELPGGRSTWIIHTKIGSMEMPSSQVYYFVVGLAEAEQRYRATEDQTLERNQ